MLQHELDCSDANERRKKREHYRGYASRQIDGS
jgi:hypothetical protein